MRWFIITSFVLLSSSAFSQIGGQSAYSFLDLNSSARVASLGGFNVSLNVNDPSLIYFNPALLHDSLHNHFALNYTNYFAGINYGYASYSRHFENYGDFAAGVHYVNYGKFIRADETGVENGNFTASEYAINLSYSKPLNDHFRAGLNIKPILSFFDTWSSYGLVTDFGLHYTSTNRLLQGGLVLHNLGFQLKSYTGEYTEPVKPEIAGGVSLKLKHAPFRFSVTTRHLETWDLTYEKPEDEGEWANVFDTVPAKTKKLEEFSDKALRHLVFGTELLLFRNFYVSMGFNYQRRQELKVETRPAMVGFSWGVGFRVSKFLISYSRSKYHLAGGTNHFSITTNLNQFISKGASK